MLLDDCFTTYNNPEVGIAAVRVLEAGGYRVDLAGLRCCGRPAISKGLLTLGRELAGRMSSNSCPARQGIPILGCEPSCLVTLVDEYRDFRLGPAADEVARQCPLVDAFVADPTRAPTCRSSRWTGESCCTAIASRRPRSAPRVRWRP